MLEKGRARLRERGQRHRDESSDEKRGRERDGKREGKGETESEGVQRESSREGGKTVDGIGGAKLSGGGLIKPS